MKLKTYRAESMADALVQVKNDLGSDAVILHTRTYRVGSVMGIGGKPMVEVTASASAEAMPPKVKLSGSALAAASGAARPAPVVKSTAAGTYAASPSVRLPSNPRLSPGDLDTPAPKQTPKPTPGRTAPPPAPRAPADLPALDEWPTPKQDAPKVHPPQPLTAPKSEAPKPQSKPAPKPVAKVELPKPAAPAPAPKTPASSPVAQAPKTPTPPPAPAQSIEPKPVDAAPASATRDALEAEVAELKKMMQDVLRARTAPLMPAAPTPPSANDSRPIARYRARLIDQDADDQTVDALIARLREVLSPSELEDESAIREALIAEIAGIIPVRHDPPRSHSPRGGPRRIALVGPTGVGKTTTVAKLAASYQLRYGLSVGLITLDTYRIAAVEQLRTYANIIGLPIEVVDSPERVETARQRLERCDTIFIDTAGRSQNDSGRLEQLADFVHAADPDETHLVMSASSSLNTLARIAHRFSPLRPDRCLLTKLDEAVTFGVLACLPARIGLPLGFVTTGQEVPDHIEPASPIRLARLVVDGPAGNGVPSTRAMTTEGPRGDDHAQV